MMRLARAKAKLPSHLTITEALALIASKKEPTPKWLRKLAVKGARRLPDFETAAEAERFWELVGRFKARGNPLPVVMKALENLVKLKFKPHGPKGRYVGP